MAEAFRYLEVEGHIMGLISSGALAPGDRLPSLRKLGTRLRLSLNTVAQAYTELEAKGLVEARPRSGFFVRTGARHIESPPKRQVESAPAEVNKSSLIRMVLDSNLGRQIAAPFGLANPAPELLPLAELARAMTAALRDMPHVAAEYSDVRGCPLLRGEIARRMQETGAAAEPGEVLVTVGAMEALSVALRAVTRPGDTVLVQSPTYYCLLQIFETLGLRTVEIASDAEEGVSPADVAAALRKFNIKACVLIPNYNNPDGSVTPDEAKREIVRLVTGRDIPLIEDDISAELHFGPERPRSCRAFEAPGKGLVLYCSSFSKTVAPGYRVGWLLPGRFMDKAAELKAMTNVCSPMPTQLAVAGFLRSGGYEKSVRRLRPALERQMQALRHAVAREFPAGTRATLPGGGMSLWVELPGNIDGVDFFLAAQEHDIPVTPGAIFTSQDRYNNFIRLSYGAPWSEAVGRAVATLGRLAGEMA